MSDAPLARAQRALAESADEWLTVKEYADRRRVHVQTVYTAIRYGRLQHPVDRVGRTIRINVSRGSIEDRMAS